METEILREKSSQILIFGLEIEDEEQILAHPKSDFGIPISRYKTSIEACKTKAILTDDQAVEIFQVKLANESLDPGDKGKRSARAVGRQYGVSDKTIRDIWTGRTWFRETLHLDKTRADKTYRLKSPGRPKGSKDKEPRQRSVRSTLNQDQAKAPDSACEEVSNGSETTRDHERAANEFFLDKAAIESAHSIRASAASAAPSSEKLEDKEKWWRRRRPRDDESTESATAGAQALNTYEANQGDAWAAAQHANDPTNVGDARPAGAAPPTLDGAAAEARAKAAAAPPTWTRSGARVSPSRDLATPPPHAVLSEAAAATEIHTNGDPAPPSLRDAPAAAVAGATGATARALGSSALWDARVCSPEPSAFGGPPAGPTGPPHPRRAPAARPDIADLILFCAAMEEEAAGESMPVSSRQEDPFHDDWPFWPKPARGGQEEEEEHCDMPGFFR